MRCETLKYMMGAGALVVVLSAVGSPWAQRSDARHAYAVHDEYRPYPPVVSVSPSSGVPSDALVLFDGSQASIDRHWQSDAGGPTKWVLDDGGCFACVKKSGYACTREKFEDIQLHVEFATAVDRENLLNGSGNSGVYLPGGYEVQILDSLIPTGCVYKGYADGICGALYGQKPPDVNVCRVQAEWQSYDIVFHPATIVGGKTLRPATLTLFHNGVLVHDHWACEAPTDWLVRDTRLVDTCGPIRLQDHGCPVRFRNIWVRRLKPRSSYAYDGEFADAEAIASKRRELADRADADWTRWQGEKSARDRLCHAWAAASYWPTPERLARGQRAEKEFLTENGGRSLSGDYRLRILYDSLRRSDVVSQDSALYRLLHTGGDAQ